MKLNKKIITFGLAGLFFCCSIFLVFKGTLATDENTPVNSAFDDINFYTCITKSLSKSVTTNLTDSQLAGISKLNCSDKSIKSIKGLEKLTGLTELNLSSNQIAGVVDLSSNPSLVKLNLSLNEISEVNVNGNTKLTNLNVSNNQLSSLSLFNNSLLTNLNVSNNKLTQLNVNNLTSLTVLDTSMNSNLEKIGAVNDTIINNLVNNTKLTTLNLSGSSLSGQIDLSSNVALTDINLSKNKFTNVLLPAPSTMVLETLNLADNEIASIYLENQTKLVTLNLSKNKFVGQIDLSKNTKLVDLDMSSNEITGVILPTPSTDVLTTLNLSSNNITSIDLTTQSKLARLNLAKNKLSGEVNFSGNSKLVNLNVSDNEITKITLPTPSTDILTSLDVSNNKLVGLDLATQSALNKSDSDVVSIGGNPYTESFYIYEGNNVTVGGGVKLPSKYSTVTKTFTNSDSTVATIDDVGKVTGIKSGTTTINGTYTISDYNISYNVSSVVNVVSLGITSDLFKIDESEGYIYVGYMNTADEILKNITKSSSDLEVSVSSDLKKLYIKYNGETLKTFNVVRISSSKFTIGDGYIYAGTIAYNKDYITCTNCTFTYNRDDETKQAKVTLKYSSGNKDELDVFDVIRIGVPTDNKIYENYLSKNYIYTSINDFDINGVVALNDNITMVVEDSKLLIKHGENIAKSFELIKIGSNDTNYSKNLSDDYIYVGVDSFDINKMIVGKSEKDSKVTYSFDETASEFRVYYDGAVVDTISIISVASKDGITYKDYLSKDYIYVGNNKFNADNITCKNCTKSFNDTTYKLSIKFDAGSKAKVKTYDIIRLTSTDYSEFLDKDYIYIGSIQGKDFNKDKISIVNSNVVKEVSDNTLYIKHGDDVVDKFELISISSNLYGDYLSKKYIFTGSKSFNVDDVVCTNTTAISKTLVDGVYSIKYGDNELQSFDIMTLSSEKYIEYLDKDYIYVGTSAFNKDNITVSKGSLSFSTDTYKLTVKYGTTTVKTFDVIRLYTSSSGDWIKDYLSLDYIYVGILDMTKDTDVSKLKDYFASYKSRATEEVKNNKLYIKHGENVVDEFDLIGIKSDPDNGGYDLSKTYLYVGASGFDSSKITIVGNIQDGIEFVETDDKISIVYEEREMKSYTLKKISFGKYSMIEKNGKKYVLIPEIITYKTLKDNISVGSKVTYKLKNGSAEVSENESVIYGMSLDVSENGELVETYIMQVIYLNFGSGIAVNHDKQVIRILNKNLTTTNLSYSAIETSAKEVKVLDLNDNILENGISLRTGYKFKALFNTDEIDYKLSVLGDVNGDGIVDTNDIKLASSHVIKKNVLNNVEYQMAADMDDNDAVNINDIIKLVQNANNN